ncbi:MAG: hypothetical protein ACI4VM_05695 [Anaerovoracaceae bacterium]
MIYRAFAAILAADLLFAMAACSETQSLTAPDKTDSAARHTEQHNDAETSVKEDPSSSGEEGTGRDSATGDYNG